MRLLCRSLMLAVVLSLHDEGASSPEWYKKLGENSDVVQEINHYAKEQIFDRIPNEMDPFSRKLEKMTNHCRAAMEKAEKDCKRCQHHFYNQFNEEACNLIQDNPVDVPRVNNTISKNYKIKQIMASIEKKTKQFFNDIVKKARKKLQFRSTSFRKLIRHRIRMPRIRILPRIRSLPRIRILPRTRSLPRIRIPRIRAKRFRFRRFRAKMFRFRRFRVRRFRFHRYKVSRPRFRRYRTPRVRVRVGRWGRRRWGKKKRNILRSVIECSMNCNICDAIEDSNSEDQIMLNVCGPGLKQEEEKLSGISKNIVALEELMKKDEENGTFMIKSVKYDEFDFIKRGSFISNYIDYEIGGKRREFKSKTPLFMNNTEKTGRSVGDQILERLRASQYIP